jgi:hypothetical protein
MLSTPLFLEFGLLALTLTVILIFGNMRPHHTGVTPHQYSFQLSENFSIMYLYGNFVRAML